MRRLLLRGQDFLSNAWQANWPVGLMMNRLPRAAQCERALCISDEGEARHKRGASGRRLYISATKEWVEWLGWAACGRTAAAASAIGRTVAEAGEADGDGGAFARSAADGNRATMFFNNLLH